MDNKFIWGGPFHKFQTKLKLESEDKSLTKRKLVFFSLFAWLPLLILSVIFSVAYNPALKVSLLTDFVVWARFFIALPVIILAENVIKFHVSRGLARFYKTGIISDNNVADFESILSKIYRIRESKIPELIILLIALFSTIVFWRLYDQGNLTSTWIFTEDGVLTIPGYWYYIISAPIFQFFLYRMVWKFFLWVYFLFRLSRMELNLVATNPDLSGGLQFVGATNLYFGIIGFAQCCIVSAQIAEWVTLGRYQLSDHYSTIAINVLVDSFILMLPIMVFVPKLYRLRLQGRMDYSLVAMGYVRAFEEKWVKGINPENEKILGSSDVQSLADLYNSYAIVDQIRTIPIKPRMLLNLVIIIALPYAPLAFFVIPADEILKTAIKFII